MSEIKDAVIVDKNSDKYKVVLKFVNQILVNLGKEKITDLLDFKDIDREDIIKDINKNILVDMKKELFDHLDKNKHNYSNRNNIKNYILTFMRKMCTNFNYVFSYYKKDITEVVNNRNYRKTHVYYSICQAE